MNPSQSLRVLLVDPSLFTAPYDAALTEGLLAAGVEPSWAVRPLRPGDRQEIAAQYVDPFFYRHIDRVTWLPSSIRGALKGVAHAFGLVRLISRVVRERPDVVHFQWLVVPPLDSLAIACIRLLVPVIVTVHDTVPFNGEYVSFWQNLGFELPLKLSDGIVVHTKAGRDTLLRRGVQPDKLAVIQHGPLPLRAVASPAVARLAHGPMTFVLFGEIKTYKGVEVLVEALGLLPAAVREQVKVVIAGRPRMNLEPVRARVAALQLGNVIEIREGRLSEQEMADLFASADCFLFPYLQIDASGVYFLVKSLGKWLIASTVGVFAEDIVNGEQGRLVPAGDAPALSAAIAQAVLERPKPKPLPSGVAWVSIGQQTRELYQKSQARRDRATTPATIAAPGERVQ